MLYTVDHNISTYQYTYDRYIVKNKSVYGKYTGRKVTELFSYRDGSGANFRELRKHLYALVPEIYVGFFPL